MRQAPRFLESHIPKDRPGNIHAAGTPRVLPYRPRERPIPELMYPWKRKFPGLQGMDRSIPSILPGHKNRLPGEQVEPKQRTGHRYARAEIVWRIRAASRAPRCVPARLEDRNHRKAGNLERFPYAWNIVQQIAGGELWETIKCMDLSHPGSSCIPLGWFL